MIKEMLKSVWIDEVDLVITIYIQGIRHLINVATIDKMFKSGWQKPYLEKIVMGQIFRMDDCRMLWQSLF